MKIPDPNDSEKEIEVFTPEEVAAQNKEKEEELSKTKAEVERLNRVSAEKTENFKKLNEMGEEEKSKFTAVQLEDRKRIEAAESKALALEQKINDDIKKRIDSDKEAALSKYHGNDPKIKEELEKNYNLINLEGNDTASIQERARLAAAMIRGSSANPNPLHAPLNGSAPRTVEKSKTEEFMKSEKAKSALKAMGEKVD